MKARRISFGSDVGYGIGGEKEEEWKGMALEDPMTCGGCGMRANRTRQEPSGGMHVGDARYDTGKVGVKYDANTYAACMGVATRTSDHWGGIGTKEQRCNMTHVRE